MIQETLERIEKRIRTLEATDETRKNELLKLFQTLKEEVTDLSKSDAERAESIARFAELSTHESVRNGGDEALKNLSLEGLSLSVKKLEATHPKLVETVNRLCLTLSGLGI